MTVRLCTHNAETAYARLREADAPFHDDAVVLLEGSPPMFSVADRDGNRVNYSEEESPHSCN